MSTQDTVAGAVGDVQSWAPSYDLSQWSMQDGSLPALHDLEISSALIFYVFLPTLIFEAALHGGAVARSYPERDRPSPGI